MHAVRFDGSYLTRVIPTQNVSGTTVFVVMKQNETVETSASLVLRDSTQDSEANEESLMLGYESSTELETHRSGKVAGYTPPSLSTPFLHGAWFDGADTKSILNDDISDTSPSVGTFGYDTIDLGYRYVYISGFPTKVFLDSINADIAEVVIYNRALTDEEFYYISGFLKYKWGL
jgi:hypothetical protein